MPSGGAPDLSTPSVQKESQQGAIVSTIPSMVDRVTTRRPKRRRKKTTTVAAHDPVSSTKEPVKISAK